MFGRRLSRVSCFVIEKCTDKSGTRQCEFLHGDIDDIGDIANFANIASAFFCSFDLKS